MNTYFTGKPCKRGHVADRYISTGACLQCMSGYRAKHRQSFVTGIYLRDFRMWSEDVPAAMFVAKEMALKHWPDMDVETGMHAHMVPKEVFVKLPCHDRDFQTLLAFVTDLNEKRSQIQAHRLAEQERQRAALEQAGWSARRIAREQRMMLQIERMQYELRERDEKQRQKELKAWAIR